MFKLESYITPLLMSYVDKYVKLKPEDFQLSLWGGDAVLNNLDLRLDVIEKAIQLPVVFKSGHIHEIRLHVPWTKLGSEPIVVTINTIECILKLRDTAYDDRHKSSRSNDPNRVKMAQGKSKPRRQDTEDIPPGYLQSLMNKIMNNLSIIVNNLIIKFVEDDMVLSINMKSAEIYSVDELWNRAFTELSSPDFILRKSVNFCDLTVCLDKCNTSGKIENYQDPLIYRCSVLGRLYMKYDGIHAKYPSVTKFDVFSDKLDISLTDTQLPMFFRLVELCVALYYGTIEFSSAPMSESSEPSQQEALQKSASMDGDKDQAEAIPTVDETESQVGWAQWAWSYVPQILPTEEEEELKEHTPKKKPEPAILSIGMYGHKVTVVFKLTEKIREKVHYGPQKVAFKPFMLVEGEGIALDILLKGLLFFDIQFGITNIKLTSQGHCICGVEDKDDLRSCNMLSGGDDLQTKISSNYYSQSLFDINCPANRNEEFQFFLDTETHRQTFTEQHGMQRFGVLWLDYLYVMEDSQDRHLLGSHSSVSDHDEEVFAKENSLMRYIIGPCTLNVSSSMVHRVQKFLHCASNHSYAPYGKEREEVVNDNRPHPTSEQITSMEEYLPTRTQHLTILQPTAVIYFAEHAQCDISKKSYKTSHGGKKKPKAESDQEPPSETLLPCIHISATRFDLQETKPMYPRKLIRMISMIAGPSSNLLHHCHAHTQVKVFGLDAGLVRVDQSGNKSHVITVIPPCSGALYTRRLLLSVYWKNTHYPKIEHMYELPQISVNLTKANILLGLRIWSSWQQKVPKPSSLSEDSLEEDIFSSDKPNHPVLPLIEINICGFEMKNCRSTLVTAYTGTVSSVQAILYDGVKDSGIPILCGPVDTNKLHSVEFFQNLTTLNDVNNDCFTCTLQIPNHAEISDVPSALLLNMEGIVASFDPGLLDWLAYSPRKVTSLSSVEGEESKVHVDMVIAHAADPLQLNASQVSVVSEGSLNRTHTETLTRTKTVSQSNMDGDKETSKPVESASSFWGKKLAALYPYMRMLQIQVDIKKSSFFINPSHLPVKEPSACIPQNYLTALSQNAPMEAIVICLPQICLHSAGLKPLSAIQDIPIQTLEGSLVGEKLPWAMCLEHFSIYTILSKEKIYPVIKPTSVNCTIAVTSVYTPPASDNISSLGLCLHTDMHAVTIGCSKPQVQLMFRCTTQLMNLINNCLEFGTVAMKYLIIPKPSSPKTEQDIVTPRKHSTALNHDREPFMTETETSGDLTSRETTASFEADLDEGEEERVNLSLWLQWTLPKFEIKFYKIPENRKSDTKVSLLVEDVTLSLDVERVYAKAKVSCASCNIHHYRRDVSMVPEWKDGDYLGILMTCHKELSHDIHISTNKLWSAEGQPTSLGNHFNLGEGTPRDVTHGFMNLTFTRALCKNVKKKMRKLNCELFGSSEGEEVTHELYFHKYISELCLNVDPCDFVIYTPAVETIMDSLEGWGFVKKPSAHKQSMYTKQTQKSEKLQHPLLTSGDLPLLYMNLSSVRMFFPSKDLKSCVSMETESSVNNGDHRVKTTLDHDLVIGLLHSLVVVPQADNPLPRYAIDKDLYHKSLQFGLAQQPGSAVEDRQYQVEVRGLALCSGCWGDFVRRSELEEKKEKSMLPIQIPALEWNTTLKPFEKPKEDIQLLPMVSSIDMRVVAAPAIVYTPPQSGPSDRVLVCGYSLEVNVTSDLDLYISSSQIHLMQDLINQSMSRLYPSKASKTSSSFTANEDVRDKLSDHQTVDSGIESDASTITHMKGNRPYVPLTLNQGQSSKFMTPFDVLLTASRISCTFYGNKILDKEIEIETKIPESRKIRKSDLECKSDVHRNLSGSSTETPKTPPAESPFGLDTLNEEEHVGFSFMNIHEVVSPEKKLLHSGSTCIMPFLYFYISQPHTVLSCLDTGQKFEMSCYDILIKGPSIKYLQIEDVKVMPDCADFSVYWIETRAGQPNTKTGIPPSLYTLRVTDFLQEPACINLKIERPLKVNLSVEKLNHLQNLVAEILPAKPTKSTPSQKHEISTKGNNSDTLQVVLSKIDRLELSTEQIVVTLETGSKFKDSGILGHVNGMNIDVILQQNSRRVESISTNLYVRDLLLKTIYKKKTRNLIGPFVLNLDAVVQWFELLEKQLVVPKVTVSMSTGLISVSVGQEHLKCFNSLKKQFQHFSKDIVKEKKVNSTGPSETKSVDVHQDFASLIVDVSTDDLRTGQFQYVMDPDGATLCAGPGEITFCNRDIDGNSTMTWCYNEPRILTDVQFTPIPFNLSVDENTSVSGDQTMLVPCQLQYFDLSTQQFVTYVDFELSENRGTKLTLPEVKEINVKEVLVSQIWRVLIRYDLNEGENERSEVMILPASLAASMQVDSCYIPSLVPMLQLYMMGSLIELKLSNHLQCQSKGVPSKLKPFTFEKSSSDEEFAVIKIRNPILVGSHMTGSLSRTSVQITSGMEVDVVEYRNLTMQSVIKPFDLYADISYSSLTKPALLESNVTVDPVVIRVGKGVVHTLNCAAQAWSQVNNGKNQESSRVVMSHYVICNDTCHLVRYGQVGTDENLVLKPREMCCYSWRTHKTTQKLHLCLDGKIWKWCDPFTIDDVGHMVRAVRTIDQKYTLIIQIKQLSNVQKQVIIRGQLSVSNRLLQTVELKICTFTKNPDAAEVGTILSSEQTTPTYVLEPEEIKCVKLRVLGQTTWTQEILVSGSQMEHSKQIKIMLHHNTYIHIWCKIFTQKIHTALHTLVLLCPLYVIRSHLPRNLFVSVETPKIKQNYQIQIPGQGRELHLDCLGSDASHSLAFHLSSEKEKSRPALTLSTGLIEQVERAKVKDFDLDKLTSDWKSNLSAQWPYCFELEEGDVLDIQKQPQENNEFQIIPPSIDLHINLSEYWPGCETLLVDVFPWCLMTNQCDLDLVVLLANGDTWTLPSKKTITPPKFEAGFAIGMVSGGNLYKTNNIHLSDEELSTHKYTLDMDRVLYMDGYVQSKILTVSKADHQVYFLTLQSAYRQGIRIITIRETFCMTNLSNHGYTASLHCVGLREGKVQPNYHSTVTISSHTKCKKDESNVCPLNKWSLQSQETTGQPKADFGGFVQYLSLMDEHLQPIKSFDTNSEESNTTAGSETDSHWSNPMRISSNESRSRMTISMPTTNGMSYPICVTSHVKNGICYFVIQDDRAPTCHLYNMTSIPVYYGHHDSSVLVSDVTVQEETELIKIIPKIPSGGSVFYTPSSINRKFHEGISRKIPKICIGINPLDIGKQNHPKPCVWSNTLDINSNFESFVPIKDAVDVKVKVEKVGTVTKVTIEPISKADVSAKEIRSRIIGKETTVSSKVEHDSTKVCIDRESKHISEMVDKMHKKELSYCVGLHMHHVCLVLQDESSCEQTSEVLRISVDNLFLAHHPSTHGFTDDMSLSDNHVCTSVCAASIQIDNQLYYAKGLYDFPVIFVKQLTSADKSLPAIPEFQSLSVIEKLAVMKSTSFAHLQIIVEEDVLGNTFVGTLELALEPSIINIDDSFVYHILKEIEGLIPTKLSHSSTTNIAVKKLPRSFKRMSEILSRPIRIKHLCVQPISILLSVHASLKLFISSDRTPLSFGTFDKQDVVSTTHQLVQVLVVHYASGALFRAGIVVGSLELLGNPTGLVRSIGTGVADLVKMPYAGLTRGPGAFVMGVSSGMSSCVKNISSGMITSVTNFASSVSRNMDRLSMDNTHLQRQEVQRRQMPDGISSGLKQGFTSFGISLLGAVAGLADQPIQNLISKDDDPGVQMSTSAAASGIVTGVGKGLLGVFAKPIGGAAELLSQTGQGLLHGTGLASNRQTTVYKPELIQNSESSNGQVKYLQKFLQSIPSNDLQMVIEAEFIDLTGSEVKVDLLLTNEILFVINCEDDTQQQAFSLPELEVCNKKGNPRLLSLQWRDSFQKTVTEQTDENKDRVAAFIDDTLVYAAPSTSTSTPCDSQSDSSLSPIGRPTVAPQYQFLLDSAYKEAFISQFCLIKNKLSGKGFTV